MYTYMSRIKQYTENNILRRIMFHLLPTMLYDMNVTIIINNKTFD